MSKKKKVLVTQAWVDEANKLQKKVLELDQVKAQLKEAQEKLEQADNMDSTLQRYIDEREEMRAMAEEVRQRSKQLVAEKDKALADLDRMTDRMRNNTINTRRLNTEVKHLKEQKRKLSKTLDARKEDLANTSHELKQMEIARDRLQRQVKRAENALERERSTRLQEIHARKLEKDMLRELKKKVSTLDRHLTEQSSIASQHTHESFVLTNALKCSRSITEEYGERMLLLDDKYVALQLKYNKLVADHEKVCADLENSQDMFAEERRKLQRLQAYMMSIAKTPSDYAAISAPPTQKQLMDKARKADADKAIILRKDAEPPLSQAPTFSSLVRAYENIPKAQARMSKNGKHVPSEKFGFSSSVARLGDVPEVNAASESTLRAVLPPGRMNRTGRTLDDSSAVGRSVYAPGDSSTEFLPWAPMNLDGTSAGLASASSVLHGNATAGPYGHLGSMQSLPNLRDMSNNNHGVSAPNSAIPSFAVGGGSAKVKRRRRPRSDGKSVATTNGSLFVGSGLGIEKPKMKGSKKGSAKKILAGIMDRIDPEAVRRVMKGK